MGLFDGLGGATEGGTPVPPKTDLITSLRPLDEPTWARMEDAYHNGLKKGETCHIKQLDPFFKWMPGYLNVWTGWMNEGKTEFIYQLLLLRAVLVGKKSAIYSPENMPQEHIYDQLIHALTGQNPDRDWQNCLPMARYKVARDFIREHFVVIYPGKGQDRTPLDLLRYFETAVAKQGVSHCLLDPWNKCNHGAMASLGGEAAYLVNVLGAIGDWTQETGQSFTITAHPRQLPDMKHGQARPIPDSSHIAGGQTWENMAHIVATYYRPWKHLGSNNADSSQVAIYVHKVKSRKLVGRPGSIGDGSENPDVRIGFEWQSNRFLINGQSPLDCRQSEQFYLSDAELRERDDMRGAAPKPPVTDYQPATLRTAGPSEFEGNPQPMTSCPLVGTRAAAPSPCRPLLMETPDFCRCPGCLLSIPPAVGAPAAEQAAHAAHLRKLDAIGSLPDPAFSLTHNRPPCAWPPHRRHGEVLPFRPTLPSLQYHRGAADDRGQRYRPHVGSSTHPLAGLAGGLGRLADLATAGECAGAAGTRVQAAAREYYRRPDRPRHLWHLSLPGYPEDSPSPPSLDEP